MFDNTKRKQERINQGENTISQSVFNLIMGGTILWGVFLNIAICFIAGNKFVNYININANGSVILIGILIGYLAISLVLLFLAYKSDNPFISFICFTGISLATGVLLMIYVPLFSTQDVIGAFILTAGTTVLMVIAGCIYPSLFLKMGRALLFALITMIVVNIIYIVAQIVTGTSMNTLGLIIDVIIAGIFTLYIAYDFSKSQLYTRTVDNAIDSALDIYIDIVNLFMRILSILGRSKD